jgi:hypothetical protein
MRVTTKTDPRNNTTRVLHSEVVTLVTEFKRLAVGRGTGFGGVFGGGSISSSKV